MTDCLRPRTQCFCLKMLSVTGRRDGDGEVTAWAISLSKLRYTTLCLKNIPDIFDCNLKTNYQVMIIFVTNIPDSTCHQMTV